MTNHSNHTNSAVSTTAPVDYVPFPCQLVAVQQLTPNEKLFRFVRTNEQHFGHKAGQFMQVSIAGIGEAPISISSSPTRGDYIEMGVRKIGTLTAAMHDLRVGDSVGMRGPFGTHFPIAELRGKDLLLIAGGCGLAPLRSMIQYTEDCIADFGKVTVLYGAKSPDDVMYKDELARLQQPPSLLDCRVTVDNVVGGTCWTSNVGLITTLFAPLVVDPTNTVAIICGPPIMYKFVIQELEKKGLTDNNIVVSLERHMKCGVGKCGHCTIEHLYCCIDGPVFWLNQVRHIRGAI